MRHRDPYPEFFALLGAFPEAPGWLELRARQPRHRRVARLWSRPEAHGEISRWLAHRGAFLDAFFGVARRDGRGGGKPHLVSLPALWADVDHATVWVPPEVPSPTAVVFTGRGHHLYWALEHALELSPDRIGAVDRLLRGLARQVGGDPGCAEAAHLLRIPGTLNAKYRPPVLASLLTLEPARRYAIEALVPFAEPEPAPEDGRPRGWTGPPPAPREGALARVLEECGFLRWAGEHQAEVSEPLWYAALTNLAVFPDGDDAAWALSHRYPGFSARELAEKLQHARDWGRPTSCARIHALGFDGCPGCPWWGRVRAPAGITLKAPAKAPASAAVHGGHTRDGR